jgi:hypothetical protein
MILKFNIISSYYESGQSTGVGFGWTTLATNITTDGFLYASVTKPGVYGLFKDTNPVSAALSTNRISWIHSLMVLVTALALW